MSDGLSADETATLCYIASGTSLRDSDRYLDDAAAQIGLSFEDLKAALTALVAAGLVVVQHLDEEADVLTGRTGRAFRVTLAGQRTVDASQHGE